MAPASGLGASGTPGNADWTARSNQSYTDLGWSVGTAGDVNGDGYSDVIVGAQQYDNVENNEGAAFVWYGSQAGLNEGMMEPPPAPPGPPRATRPMPVWVYQ